MHLGFKYRVYPTEEQKVFFAKSFGCCRKVWNLMLADKNNHYKETGKTLHPTPAQYKKEYPFLKEVDSLALANVQMQLNRAFKNFFENPKNFRFPQFKSKKRSRRSYTTNNQKGTIQIMDHGIKLPKVGMIHAIVHRLPGPEWIIKSATISQKSDGSYYISLLCEKEEEEITPLPVFDEKVLGLDYKSDGLYMDSNGRLGDMPKFFQKAQKRLVKRQRKLKNKDIHSKNYQKQLKKIAKLYVHTADQRKDFLHKKSAAITKQYDYVVVEDLNMRSMANKGFGNGKATLDNGYGMFLTMLEYKLHNKGGKLEKVDRWFPSSQLCSCCGSQNQEVKKLNVRTWICPKCGSIHDRDLNAAVNIKNEGLRILRSAA